MRLVGFFEVVPVLNEAGSALTFVRRQRGMVVPHTIAKGVHKLGGHGQALAKAVVGLPGNLVGALLGSETWVSSMKDQ